MAPVIVIYVQYAILALNGVLCAFNVVIRVAFIDINVI